MLEPGRMSGGHFLERIREAQFLERIRGGQFLELIRAGQFPERRSCCLLRVLRMCKLADPGQFQGRIAFLARCVHVGLGLEQLAEAGVVAVLRLMYQGRQAAVAGRLHDGLGREEPCEAGVVAAHRRIKHVVPICRVGAGVALLRLQAVDRVFKNT